MTNIWPIKENSTAKQNALFDSRPIENTDLVWDLKKCSKSLVGIGRYSKFLPKNTDRHKNTNCNGFFIQMKEDGRKGTTQSDEVPARERVEHVKEDKAGEGHGSVSGRHLTVLHHLLEHVKRPSNNYGGRQDDVD